MKIKHNPKQLQNSRAGRRERSSNLELYRIIAMLLIVAHHYVVNSDLIETASPIYSNPFSGKSLFYLLFGAWGKTGINCFVLITGYFMCKSQITIRKFIKLLAEVMFYQIAVAAAFWISGYQPFGLKELIKALVPIKDVDRSFTECYLIFYLFIPFLNILVHNLNEKQHMKLIALCAFMYVFFGTVHRVRMNYVSWFSVLYVMASYIRLYPKPWFDNTKLWGILSAVSALTAGLSVVFCAWIAANTDRQEMFYFVTDSNAFLAVTTGLCSFMFFKNLKIPQSKLINTVAASTFGVLLIHCGNYTMRGWLWNDTLNNMGAYDLHYPFIHAILSVFGVFVVCTVIDMLRIRLLERPFLKFVDKHIT